MSMKESVARVVELIDNRSNPILVKEIRQALHSNVFVVLFLALLLVNVIICLVGTVGNLPIDADDAFGMEMFVGLAVAYGILSLLLLPLISMMSIEKERSSYTFEILQITRLTTYQVVRGKLYSVYVQLLIYMSAFFPFMMFTYLARGITVFQIMAGFTFITLIAAWLVMLGFVFGTGARVRAAKSLLQLAGFASFIFAGSMTVAALGATDFFTDNISSSEFVLAAVSFLVAYAFSFVILYLAVVNQLSPRVTNCSRGFRVASLLFTAVSLLITGAMQPFYGHTGDYRDFVIGVIMVNLLWWCVMFLFSSAEEVDVPPALIRRIPRSHLARTVLRLLIPGGTRGYVLSMLMILILLTAIISMGMLYSMRSGYDELAIFSVTTAGYVLFFVSLALVLSRRLERFLEMTPMRRRAFVVILVGSIVLLSMILMLVVQLITEDRSSYGRYDYSWMQILNPFYSIVVAVDRDRIDIPVVVACLGLIGIVMNMGWLAAGHRRLKDTIRSLTQRDAALEPPAAAEGEDGSGAGAGV